MLRDMVREVAKTTSNKISSPLFSIKLKHTSSLYFATIDDRIVYGGEIYQCEQAQGSVYLSIISSDAGQLLIHENDLKVSNILIKVKTDTFLLQSHYKIADINSYENMWDIGLHLTKPDQIIKIGE